MEEKELAYDKLLKIKTVGRDDTMADQHKHPYEPTPYVVLERLANSGFLKKRGTLLDYGCGKGRVGFYLSYQLRCNTIGIEFDKRIYEAAMQNVSKAAYSGKVSFFHQRAECYEVPNEVDAIFFFNPFSVAILQKVFAKIRDSYYESPRTINLFFYYPSVEYVGFLSTCDDIEFVDEIDCMDLFEGENAREVILIYRFIS